LTESLNAGHELDDVIANIPTHLFAHMEGVIGSLSKKSPAPKKVSSPNKSPTPKKELTWGDMAEEEDW
jgi:hypothetical protein